MLWQSYGIAASADTWTLTDVMMALTLHNLEIEHAEAKAIRASKK